MIRGRGCRRVRVCVCLCWGSFGLGGGRRGSPRTWSLPLVHVRVAGGAETVRAVVVWFGFGPVAGEQVGCAVAVEFEVEVAEYGEWVVTGFAVGEVSGLVDSDPAAVAVGDSVSALVVEFESAGSAGEKECGSGPAVLE